VTLACSAIASSLAIVSQRAPLGKCHARQHRLNACLGTAKTVRIVKGLPERRVVLILHVLGQRQITPAVGKRRAQLRTGKKETFGLIQQGLLILPHHRALRLFAKCVGA
jgi:hypothetical protein